MSCERTANMIEEIKREGDAAAQQNETFNSRSEIPAALKAPGGKRRRKMPGTLWEQVGGLATPGGKPDMLCIFFNLYNCPDK